MQRTCSRCTLFIRTITMDDDRCCGTGTCIINDEGLCWCGQQWNGERMCFPEKTPSAPATETTTDGTDDGGD
jgi:hypothetical protein